MVCSNDLGNKFNLSKHIDDPHTYCCNLYGFMTIDEEIEEYPETAANNANIVKEHLENIETSDHSST